MVDITNSFDSLPDEVLQLIFAAVADCKSLVRCMAVSKAFKEQSSRVSALSISCPGQFSSYDQKLRGIYAMVKEFHSLESLIVRVGQPKDEPPSWARCMRYAEIGASVEKFVFMAAKSGDFSEFDYALGGGRDVSTRHGGRDPEAAEIMMVVNDGDGAEQPLGALDPGRRESANLWDGSSSDRRSEMEGRGDTSQPLNLGLDLQGESNPGVHSSEEPEASSRTLLPLLRPARGGTYFSGQSSTVQDEGHNGGDAGGILERNGNITAGILGPGPGLGNRRLLDQRRLLLEQGDFSQESHRLPDFNLRQVIAPSNDVLKRMVPVIVFAIVQGLDEFRDSVPEFIARFTELKRFLLVDMVESVTVHMRDQQIQEIRLQRLREKEGERQGRGYEKEMAQADLGSPVLFAGRKESESGKGGNSGQGPKTSDDRGRPEQWESGEEKPRKEIDRKAPSDRSAVSSFVMSPRVNTLQQKDSRGKGLKADLSQAIEGKGLKIDVGNLWNIERRNQEDDSSGNESAKEKGKLMAQQDTLVGDHEGDNGKLKEENPPSPTKELNCQRAPSLTVWQMGEGTAKSQALGDVGDIRPIQNTRTLFSNSLLQQSESLELSSNCSHQQKEPTSQLDCTLSLKAASTESPNCKRCENLRAVGKDGPCWNCSTKERLEKPGWGSSSADKESYRWASDNPYLGATHKERRGCGWYGRDRSDFGGSGHSLRRLSTFEKLVGGCGGEGSARMHNLFPGQPAESVVDSDEGTRKSDSKATSLLLPVESAPLSSYVSLSNLSLAGRTSLGSLLSDDLEGSFNKGDHGLKDSGGSGEEGLWEAGQSMFPSSGEDTETNLKVDSANEGRVGELLRNPRELGRSRSFDSLESLKDKEERQEILNLERERLAAEKAKEQTRQQPTKRNGSSDSIEKLKPADTGKGKKLKEKTEGNVLDGTPSQRRSWKAGESAREGKLELAGKYSFKRNLRADALKRREGDRALRIGSFRNRDEGRRLDREGSVEKQKDTAAADTDKAEKNEVGGESREDSVGEAAQSSSDVKNMEFPETSGVGFWAKGGLREATGFRLVGDESSCLETRLTEGLLKERKGKQVLDDGSESEPASELESKEVSVSRKSSNRSWEVPAPEFQGVLTAPFASSPDSTAPLNFGSLGGLDLRPSAVTSEGTSESSDSHEEGPARRVPGRGRERQRAREEGHFGWTRRRDQSGEQLRSAGDMRTERERLVHEAAQLGIPGLEERVAERETWRETWRERVGRRVREMRRETQGQGESEREQEARRERLREGVRKRQRDIEREALFFDISFWRAEQIVARGYCLSDVSMCIATHSAKPLTPLELEILSRAALAGPLLAATVAHVNKQVGSHNL